MKISSYIAAAALAATACAHSQPREVVTQSVFDRIDPTPVDNLVNKVGKQRVTSMFDTRDREGYIVAIVTDKPHSVACQQQNYKTIEQLANRTAVVGFQGYVGSLEHNSKVGKTLCAKYNKLSTFGAQIDLWKEGKAMLPKPDGANLHASLVAECASGHWFEAYGLEDKALYEHVITLNTLEKQRVTAMDTLRKGPRTQQTQRNYLMIQQEVKWVRGIKKTVDDGRSHAAARNIIKAANEKVIGDKNVAIALIGADNQDVVTADLKQAKVSYIVIENSACKGDSQ